MRQVIVQILLKFNTNYLKSKKFLLGKLLLVVIKIADCVLRKKKIYWNHYSIYEVELEWKVGCVLTDCETDGADKAVV